MRAAFFGFVAAATLLAGCASPSEDAQSRTDRWSVVAPGGCVALTAGWTIAPESLAALVGERNRARGVLLLFAAQCDDSWISERATGPFRVGAVLIPIEPPAVDELGLRPPDGWVVAPQTFATADVLGLFERHGFVASQASVEVSAEPSDEGLDVRMSIGVGASSVVVEATVAGFVSPYSAESAILGTAPARNGVFHGRESSERWHGEAVSFESSGETLLPALGIARPPDFVTLDADYRWGFLFVSRPR